MVRACTAVAPRTCRPGLAPVTGDLDVGVWAEAVVAACAALRSLDGRGPLDSPTDAGAVWWTVVDVLEEERGGASPASSRASSAASSLVGRVADCVAVILLYIRPSIALDQILIWIRF